MTRPIWKQHTVDVVADPDCRNCHGTGETVDWVPYGSTDVPMYMWCDCIAPRWAMHVRRLDDPSYTWRLVTK